MQKFMNGLVNYAQKYHEKHLDKPVEYFFMPESIKFMFLHLPEYDFKFGDHFCDYTWYSGFTHEKLMSDIHAPTVFIHAKDAYTADGILMAASSDEQARKAVSLIDKCELVELSSNHDIHRFHPKVFIEAVNKLK